MEGTSTNSNNNSILETSSDIINRDFEKRERALASKRAQAMALLAEKRAIIARAARRIRIEEEEADVKRMMADALALDVSVEVQKITSAEKKKRINQNNFNKIDENQETKKEYVDVQKDSQEGAMDTATKNASKNAPKNVTKNVTKNVVENAVKKDVVKSVPRLDSKEQFNLEDDSSSSSSDDMGESLNLQEIELENQKELQQEKQLSASLSAESPESPESSKTNLKNSKKNSINGYINSEDTTVYMGQEARLGLSREDGATGIIVSAKENEGWWRITLHEDGFEVKRRTGTFDVVPRGYTLPEETTTTASNDATAAEGTTILEGLDTTSVTPEGSGNSGGSGGSGTGSGTGSGEGSDSYKDEFEDDEIVFSDDDTDATTATTAKPTVEELSGNVSETYGDETFKTTMVLLLWSH